MFSNVCTFGALAMTATQNHQETVAETVNTAIMEAFNEGDPDRIDGVFTEDFVCHLTGGMSVEGSEGYKERIRGMRTAFPDFHKELAFFVTDGDEAAVQYRWSGTHDGEFMGVEPTGNRVESTSVALLRFEEGKLAEMWAYSDGQTVMQQLEGDA
ncbi:ester cyclase [Halopenitus persicus]|uniref:ester cyclase n=1 Tax=Halopenitus persicus TaxID=1048396 RepID=UPI000BBA60D1|nr:ester cyclase [Halopenitus persicus]